MPDEQIENQGPRRCMWCSEELLPNGECPNDDCEANLPCDDDDTDDWSGGE